MPAVAVDRRKESYARWDARVKNSQRVTDEQKKKYWDVLEEAQDGIFPTVIDGGPREPVGGKGRLRISEQVDCNLIGWSSEYYRSICTAGFPKLLFARDIKADKDVVADNENLAARLYDEGDGQEATAEAVHSSLSRGVCWIWVDVLDEDATPEEIVNSSLSPSEFTQAAIVNPGQPIEIPEGADYEGIAEAAEALLANPDVSLGFSDEQLNSLRMLADAAKVLQLKALEGPHRKNRRARVKFTAVPYGTWGGFDVSVTNLKRIGFLWRKLVFSPEEYVASRMFNAKSKAWVRDRFETVFTRGGDAQASGTIVTSSSTSRPSENLDARERLTVYELWDRVNWTRMHLLDGYDDFAHASDKYPFLGKGGRPALRGFFPCSIRVPIKAATETAEGMSGVPLLERGWPWQMEYIKVLSAYIQATKRSKRQGVFPPEIQKEWITALMGGPDGSAESLPNSYDQTKHGPPFTPILWPDAPMDYLRAAAEIRRGYCTSQHIAELTMTSESPNPNLGQDQLAMAGAQTMQGAILRCYESCVAEASEIGLTLFRNFASVEEITSYLGAGSDFREPIMDDVVDPMTGVQGQKPKMVMNPDTGQPEPATKPSRVDKFRAVSLDRDRLNCRFAINVQGDTAVRVNQMQNYIALNNATLDPIGRPYKNPDSLLDELAEMQEIHGVEPMPADDAMKTALMQGVAAGGPNGNSRQGPGGGRTDGHQKNGERGPGGVPGKQGRERGPDDQQHMTARTNRAASAV